MVDLAIKRITLLLSGDLTTVNILALFQAIHKYVPLYLLLRNTLAAPKVGPKLCKQFPVEKVSFFQFESYIKRFEKGDERTFKALLPEMTSSFAGPG